MDSNMIRRCGLPVVLLLVMFLCTGCGDSQDKAADQAQAAKEEVTETTAGVAEDVVAKLTAAEEALVTQVAAIATALDKAPATAGAVMDKYGMTADEYEAAIYKIASNPALSAAFEKAKGQ